MSEKYMSPFKNIGESILLIFDGFDGFWVTLWSISMHLDHLGSFWRVHDWSITTAASPGRPPFAARKLRRPVRPARAFRWRSDFWPWHFCIFGEWNDPIERQLTSGFPYGLVMFGGLPGVTWISMAVQGLPSHLPMISPWSFSQRVAQHCCRSFCRLQQGSKKKASKT
jgi:hypothetical protein